MDRKNFFKRIISILTVVIIIIPTFTQLAISAEGTEKYPYNIFGRNGIEINAVNLCINGDDHTNKEANITAQEQNINGKITSGNDIEKRVKHIYADTKIREKYFTENCKLHKDKYIKSEMNIHINNPIFSYRNIELDGNVALNSNVGTLMNINVTGEVNANTSVVYSKYGNITIENDSTSNINGLIYAPLGTITINSPNVSINGVIIADKVIINGNSVNLNGNDNISRFIGTESEVYDFIDLEYLPEDCLDDTDEDGLFDIYEKVIDTDSLNFDTDGDKLSDGYEVLTLNTDPLKVDTDNNGISDADEDFDNDNLNNLGEYKNKTEPYNTDTDEDGLLDGDEVKKYKTDPLNPDTDDDGLLDSDELHIGLDPLNSETFGIPDSEYISEQIISEDSKTLLDINKNESPYKLSIEVESTGYFEGNLIAKESKYSKSIENNSILGVPFDLSCNNTCHANKTVIKFNISDEYINSDLSAFDNETDMQGIKRYTIFKFFKDSNILLPIETKYDESSNIVFAEVDELGTYCIVDMEKMFVNFEYNKIPEQNTPQVALFNIDTTEEIEAVADIPMMLSETENEVITDPDTPLDIVFLLQIEGTREDKFQLEVDAIRKSAELIFEAYNDARISIITYDTLASMRYLETDVGGSDGKKQRYLTSLESVNAALDTVEYTYSIDTINRGYPIYVMLNSAEFRENAYKFAFHLANGKAQCGNNAMDTLHIKFIRECGEKNINYSEFIPANCECYPIEEQINADIEVEKTGGMALMPSEGSGNIIYYIIDRNTPKINVPIEPDNPVEEDFNIVLPTSWEKVTLVDKLNSDNGANSDTDTLTDWEETDTESGLITWNDNGEIQLPTVQECLEKYSDKEYVQNVLEKYVNTVPSDAWNMFLNEEILPIHSNPCDEDTDGDGLNDDEDFDPLNALSENDKIIYDFFENAKDFEVRFVLENPWLQEMGTIQGIKCVEIFRNHRTDRDPDVMREEMIAAGLLVEQEDNPFWQKFLQWLGGNYMNPAAMLYAEYELYEKDMSFSQILNYSWETWSNDMKVAIQIWLFGVSDLIQQNWEQWDYSASYKLSLYEEQAIKKNIDFSNKYLISDNTNNYGIDPSKLEMTETVKKHYSELFKGDRIITINNEGYRTIHYAGESTRPYVAKGSSIIMDEIMKAGTPVSDPQGVTGGLKWIVEGYLNNVHGYWELVVDTEKNMVIHFLFNSK